MRLITPIFVKKFYGDRIKVNLRKSLLGFLSRIVNFEAHLRKRDTNNYILK